MNNLKQLLSEMGVLDKKSGHIKINVNQKEIAEMIERGKKDE